MRLAEAIYILYRATQFPSNDAMSRPCGRAAALASLLGLSAAWADEQSMPMASRLDLPVVRIVERYPPYADFCRRRPDQCRLDGARSIEHDERLRQRLHEVSATVNHEVRFALDRDIYAVEDYWNLPSAGYGDCEDMALAKRAELVRRGYPSAALRLAFVFDQSELSSHCVLTVETTGGTLVLDSETDAVHLWHETSYNFEARERPDGRWDRYDQTEWRFNGALPSGP